MLLQIKGNPSSLGGGERVQLYCHKFLKVIPGEGGAVMVLQIKGNLRGREGTVMLVQTTAGGGRVGSWCRLNRKYPGNGATNKN